MTESRTQILRKIRQALTVSGSHHQSEQTMQHGGQPNYFASGQDFESLVKKFQEELVRAGGEVRVCSDGPSAIELIKTFIGGEGFQAVAVSRHEICQQLDLVARLSDMLPRVRFLVEGIDSENPYARARLKEQMASAKLSITGIEYLVAETGTLVSLAHPKASRQISLLPEVHMVLATFDQVRANLSEVFAEIQAKCGTSLPISAITLITGPSRTADIEKVLIKGVHGPTHLVAVLLEKLE